MQCLFGRTINLLSNMLDFRAERHKIIVSNISNIDTPEYKPKELVFNKALEETTNKRNQLEMVRTNSKHLPSVQGNDRDYQVVLSGEKVEIDMAMANLAENNLMYNLTVELLSRKFNGINTILKETK